MNAAKELAGIAQRYRPLTSHGWISSSHGYASYLLLAGYQSLVCLEDPKLACGRSAQVTASLFEVCWKFHLDKAVIPLFIAMRSRAACFRPMTNAPQLLCYGVRLL